MAEVNFFVTEEELKDATSGAPRRFGPGNYNFTVVEAALMENSSWKSSKIKLTMVAEYNGRDYKIFDDLWLSQKAKWKYARFAKSVGLDPTKPIDTDEMEGLSGMFRLKKQDDSNYMEPGTYYTQEEAAVEEIGPFPEKPQTGRNYKVAGADGDEDIFF